MPGGLSGSGTMQRVGSSAPVPDGYLSSMQVCKEVGITYRQLVWWCISGWVPGQVKNPGSGTRRLWTPPRWPGCVRSKQRSRKPRLCWSTPD